MASHTVAPSLSTLPPVPARNPRQLLSFVRALKAEGDRMSSESLVTADRLLKDAKRWRTLATTDHERRIFDGLVQVFQRLTRQLRATQKRYEWRRRRSEA
jgi:hypothetical protein